MLPTTLATTFWRKMGASAAIALSGIFCLWLTAAAQTPTPTVEPIIATPDLPTSAQSIAVESITAAAAITETAPAGVATTAQAVPLTLTLTIPGPSGPITIEVPVLVTLEFRINIDQDLNATVAVTPSLVSPIDGSAAITGSASLTATVPVTVPTGTDDAETNDTTADDADDADAPVALATATPLATGTPASPGDDTIAEVEPTVAPTVAPTATPVLPTPTPTAEPIIAAACADPRSVISAPGVNQTVSGSVNVTGTAIHENFLYYKVEYAEGANIDPTGSFSFLADSRVQVSGSTLASFDSTNFANGAYTLKLTVVDNTGNFPPPCTVSIVVAN